MSGKKIPLTSAFLTAAVQSCAASIPWQLPALTDSTGKKQHNASQRQRGHWTWRGYRRRERRQNIMQLHMCARNACENTLNGAELLLGAMLFQSINFNSAFPWHNSFYCSFWFGICPNTHQYCVLFFRGTCVTASVVSPCCTRTCGLIKAEPGKSSCRWKRCMVLAGRINCWTSSIFLFQWTSFFLSKLYVTLR